MLNPGLSLATSADIERILPLFRAYQNHYHSLTIASEEQTRRFLTQHLKEPDRGFFVVAEAGASIVGFASVYLTASGLIAEQVAHLGDLYVDPGFRNRGVGTVLFNKVVEETRARGIPKVRWLSLCSNSLNDWYKTLGESCGEFQLFLRDTQVAGPMGNLA